MLDIKACCNLFSFDVVVSNRKSVPLCKNTQKEYKRQFEKKFGTPALNKRRGLFPNWSGDWYYKIEISKAADYIPYRDKAGRFARRLGKFQKCTICHQFFHIAD